eukprot:SAG31_NODE_5731_length_2356_cov_1.221090_2_plen_66_part_00
MTWAPAHPVKCALYKAIKQGKLQHDAKCTASAVKCNQGGTDPAKCALFGSPSRPANKHVGSQNQM